MGRQVRRPSALRPGAHPGGRPRQTRRVRRSSAGLTPTRAGALLVMLAAMAGIFGAATSDAFAISRTELSGATWTPAGELEAALAIPPGQNLFAVSTSELARRVEAIPAVRTARVEVALPDTLRVTVSERVALLVWKAGPRELLVDGTGFLFGELPDAGPSDAGPSGARLPVVDDQRLGSAHLDVGDTLDAVSLDAALRIGSLTPADVGSSASRLAIRVDDTDGFTVTAEPVGWTAVFGFYTPTLRTTDLIPGQVRLLRSLLLGREDTVLRIVLADDHSGTYVPRPTPSPSSTARP